MFALLLMTARWAMMLHLPEGFATLPALSLKALDSHRTALQWPPSSDYHIL